MRVIGGEKGNSRAPYAEHAPRERNPRRTLSSNGSTVGGSCRWSVSPAFGTGTIQRAQCHAGSRSGHTFNTIPFRYNPQ
jgi:hypothetical protein